MFLLKILLFFCTYVLGENHHRLYKKLVMNANDWTKFVHKTMNFDVKTKIECGASCNHQSTQCDMFISFTDDLVCHIGTFENGNQNFLNGPSGDYPVYLSIGNFFSVILSVIFVL